LERSKTKDYSRYGSRADRAAVAIPCKKQPGRELFTHQMVNPDPGQRPECHFQCAGPIDSPAVRVLCEPALELSLNFSEIYVVEREQIGLSQKDEVLVPVQLPNELVVASPGYIQIWDSPEIIQTGLYSARVIATPADLWARVDISAENRERVFSDLRGQFDDFLGETSAV
jgi:hypothetical protein